MGKIEISYTEDVTLTANVTEKMLMDWIRCRRTLEEQAGVSEEMCETCSLNIDLDEYNCLGLCELQRVKAELDKMIRREARS